MHNCVFVDESDALDKIDFLFHNEDVLQRITIAGHELVRSRHLSENRSQIFDWFTLRKTLKPGERIIQRSAFERLEVVEISSGKVNLHTRSDQVDRVLLRCGDDRLWNGLYEAAERYFITCLNYHPLIPEALLRLALCNLFAGNAVRAMEIVLEPIQRTIETHKAADPDPVEWGYLIVCLLCQGKLEDAWHRCRQFPALHHQELDRVRRVVRILTHSTQTGAEALVGPTKSRRSVHQFPARTVTRWTSDLCVMLKACGQGNSQKN